MYTDDNAHRGPMAVVHFCFRRALWEKTRSMCKSKTTKRAREVLELKLC